MIPSVYPSVQSGPCSPMGVREACCEEYSSFSHGCEGGMLRRELSPSLCVRACCEESSPLLLLFPGMLRRELSPLAVAPCAHVLSVSGFPLLFTRFTVGQQFPAPLYFPVSLLVDSSSPSPHVSLLVSPPRTEPPVPHNVLLSVIPAPTKVSQTVIPVLATFSQLPVIQVSFCSLFPSE